MLACAGIGLGEISDWREVRDTQVEVQARG